MEPPADRSAVSVASVRFGSVADSAGVLVVSGVIEGSGGSGKEHLDQRVAPNVVIRRQGLQRLPWGWGAAAVFIHSVRQCILLVGPMNGQHGRLFGPLEGGEPRSSERDSERRDAGMSRSTSPYRQCSVPRDNLRRIPHRN